MNKRFLFQLALLFFFIAPFLYSLNISGGHRKDITSLIHNGDTIISADEDGFIVIWNVQLNAAIDRFQLTPYKIQSMIKHPSRAEICIVETSGDSSIISVWNYKFKYKLFSLQSTETVTYINYSAAGNIIISAGLNGSYLTLLDSGTGEVISTPEIPEASVTFAMTGRSERNMLLYQPEYLFQFEHENYSGLYGGQLLYYDLNTSSVTQSIRSNGNLFNPVIFGNGRFLAGIQSGNGNNGKLLVIDVVTGALLNSYDMDRNALLCSAEDGFYCLSRDKDSWLLLKFTVNSRRNLTISQRLSLSFDGEDTINSIAYNDSVVFAQKGAITFLDRSNEVVPFTFNFQTLITEIAAGKNNIAFLTESGEFCLIPLDYRLLKNEQTLTLKNKSDFSRITSLILPPIISQLSDYFILWQSENTQNIPQVIQSNNPDFENNLNFLAGRYPIRSITSGNGNFLVLDTAGNSSVYNTDKTTKGDPSSTNRVPADFTFTSIGTMDSIFVDSENFLICRSVIRGSTPFLFINSKTGETVPVSIQAQAGLTAYTGKSGKVYAVALEQENFKLKTTVIDLTTVSSVKLYEFPGDDVNLSIAESGGRIAIACGSDGANIYGKEVVSFDRSEGLPIKLLGCDEFFICLDSEGSISWHDNKTGKMLALFKLYEDKWTLSNGREISGAILPF